VPGEKVAFSFYGCKMFIVVIYNQSACITRSNWIWIYFTMLAYRVSGTAM